MRKIADMKDQAEMAHYLVERELIDDRYAKQVMQLKRVAGNYGWRMYENNDSSLAGTDDRVFIKWSED